MMGLFVKKVNVGLTVGIPSVAQGTIGVESSVEKRDISTLSLQGEVIEPRPDDPYTFARPLIGTISGFSANEIKKKELVVEVEIMTDQWYPQGKASVAPNGTWAIEKVSFGGVDHLVKVMLLDKKRENLATFNFIITVKRKQEKSEHVSDEKKKTVVDIYQQILERYPDPEGLFNYGWRLQNGEMSARQIILEIGKSDEYFSKFVGHPVTPKNAVTYFYKHFLAREPEKEMVAEHVDLLSKNGKDGWKLIVEKLVKSAEYLEKFGEHSVPK